MRNGFIKLAREKHFIVFVCAAAIAILWFGTGYALDADDFLPPVLAAPEQKEELMSVKDESSVKTAIDPVLNKEITTAATLQDAFNKLIASPKAGCRIVAEPGGGYAFLATGQATYKADYQNITASRIDQRNAYVQAFMEAKAEMAKTVGEIVVRGATDFERKIERLDTETRGLTNIEEELSEEQMQTVRKVLKGYVTYAVRDDEGIVYVSIASSSKTRGNFSRNGTDGLAATNLRDGLNSLISEIRNGFVPPVGGRIIEVPGTGEVAFVGFGSSVVPYDAERDVQEELKLQAERIAGMRAVDALAGIILGDDTLWEAHVDQTTTKQRNDFERLQESDQTSRGSDEEIKAYEERKRAMRSIQVEDTKIQSLRQGVLPPGVMRETSLNDDEHFAYGIAVYVPSLSDAARGAAKEMDDAELVAKPSETPSGAVLGTTGGQDQTQNPKQEIKRGPSGVVEQDL
jgi:hypothetical protein